MFKSDLSCRKTEIYFTSRNSVGKPAYPAAQVEVPSLTLSDSSLPLSPRAQPLGPVDSSLSMPSSDLGPVIFISAPSSRREHVSLHLPQGPRDCSLYCALAPVQALLYNEAMLHICISAPLCAPQLLQLR